MNILRSALVLAAFTLTLPAQVPLLLNYQGRVVVGTTNFNGTGQFKFALVNTNGTTTFWSNDGTSAAGSQPTNAVSLAVSNGLYSVLLGDTTLANMTATIPGNLFNNLDVRLRVWFNDGTNGSQLLSPDQRIGSVGYAGVAGTVPDNAITTTKISTGAVQSNNIGTGAVTSAKLASGLTLAGTTSGTFSGSLAGNASTATSAVSATNFTGSLAGDVTGTQGATQIAAGAVTAAEINPTSVQRRVTGTAPAGSFLTGINQDGTVTSAAGGGGGGPWLLNGTSAYYNGGNVGIGITSPLSKLHLSGVADALRLTGSSPFITLDDTAFGLYSRIQANGAGMTFKTQGAVTGSNPGGLIHLDGTGTVGIGTTTPLEKLTIAGVSNYNTGLKLTGNATGGTGLALESTAAGGRKYSIFSAASGAAVGAGGFGIYDDTAANYRLAITAGGNVGIGTAVPASKLTVSQSGYGIEHTDGTSRLATWAGAGGWLGTISAHSLYFFTSGGGSQMTLNTSGNLGIGTASPLARLQVHTLTASSADNTAVFSAPNLGGNMSHVHYGTTGDWFIRSASGSGKVILQDTGGNVAIGTTGTGSARLEVRAATGNSFGIFSSADTANAVQGQSTGGVALRGDTTSGTAVYGETHGSGAAGFFSGRVEVRGTFSVVGTKNFKIDHPLDPANKYLNHAAIESSEVLNLYSGNASLDANGQAAILLPDWFIALNEDFRYQLTAIGGPAPNLHVLQEISDNQFRIGGGQPGGKVSWQVSARRNDAYMQAHAFEVEQAKPEGERGTYLYQ